jgi:hypothetical protein
MRLPCLMDVITSPPDMTEAEGEVFSPNLYFFIHASQTALRNVPELSSPS